MIKNKYSAVAFLSSIFVILALSYKNSLPFILTWDTFGYSAYLPLTFVNHSLILHDLSFFEHANSIYNNTTSLYQFITLENGNVITKYTMGWSVAMLPFYAIGHLWASLSHYPADGYSMPYQFMTAIGSSFYTLLGLYFFRKLLLHFFTDRITALTLLLIVFGTNYLYMQIYSMGSTHTLEFCFLSLLILLTIRFHANVTLRSAFYLGACIGIIGLIRPPDLLFALIPFAWNSGGIKGLKSKIQLFWKEHRKATILAISTAFSFLFLQSLYWKISTGHFLINSYMNNAGEGFDWFTPYLTEVLFSFRKGWLIYTPLLLFAVVGLFIWKKKDPRNGNLMIILFFLFLYVVSCWTTWWYAASFGQRPMVDIYPLLGIGMGYFLVTTLQTKTRIAQSFIVLIIVFTGFNLFQTYQMTIGIIDPSLMTRKYYLSVFGQTSPPTEKQKEYLLIDRIKGHFNGFQNQEKYRICYSTTKHFENNFELNDSIIYTTPIDLIPSELSDKDHVWIRSTWKYEGKSDLLNGKIFSASGLYKSNAYSWVGRNSTDSLLQIDTLNKTVTFDYLSPEMRSKKDPVRVLIWKQGGLPIRIKSVRIQVFETKN